MPVGARGSQEEPGEAKRCQEKRKSQGEPRSARGSQGAKYVLLMFRLDSPKGSSVLGPSLKLVLNICALANRCGAWGIDTNLAPYARVPHARWASY